MIDFHLSIDYVSVHWFVLWVLFWVGLALYIAWRQDK
jgi:hypothetical protein